MIGYEVENDATTAISSFEIIPQGVYAVCTQYSYMSVISRGGESHIWEPAIGHSEWVTCTRAETFRSFASVKSRQYLEVVPPGTSLVILIPEKTNIKTPSPKVVLQCCWSGPRPKKARPPLVNFSLLVGQHRFAPVFNLASIFFVLMTYQQFTHRTGGERGCTPWEPPRC
jgi:hypothetical protein